MEGNFQLESPLSEATTWPFAQEHTYAHTCTARQSFKIQPLPLRVRHALALRGNEQEEGKWNASGWKCVATPPLSSLLIYLSWRVYFYGTHEDPRTTALIYQGISEYRHGVNHSDGCITWSTLWKYFLYLPTDNSSNSRCSGYLQASSWIDAAANKPI